MRKAKMMNWLLIEYDATRAGRNQDHERICALVYVSVLKMMVDRDVESFPGMMRGEQV